jgi:hypothetical protein
MTGIKMRGGELEMAMKMCRLLLILSILVWQPVLSLAAKDVPIGQWSGAGGLTVPVEGDGGTCPPTSHGHGVENPCPPIEAIKGPDTPGEGSQYTVEGGKPPFSWTISAGTIDAESGAIESLSGACGSGEITVTDACGKTKSLPVRFPSGKWVKSGTFGESPCGDWWVDTEHSCEKTTGTTKYRYRWRHYNNYDYYFIGCATRKESCKWVNQISENPCTGEPLNNYCWEYSWMSSYYPVEGIVFTWECP